MRGIDGIPYFVRIRGCINCSASKTLKERTGNEYGFDHELLVRCSLMGCDDYGHNLTHPFYDPAEIRRLAAKINEPGVIERAEQWASRIEQEFSEVYGTRT